MLGMSLLLGATGAPPIMNATLILVRVEQARLLQKVPAIA